MKKKIVALLVGSMILTVMAGCGKDDGAPATEVAQTVIDEPAATNDEKAAETTEEAETAGVMNRLSPFSISELSLDVSFNPQDLNTTWQLVPPNPKELIPTAPYPDRKQSHAVFLRRTQTPLYELVQTFL